MIVIDVGCARYGGDYSIERLIEMYHPDTLYGFDPSSSVETWSGALPEVIGVSPGGSVSFRISGTETNVYVYRKAAWVHDGEVRFLEDGLNGQTGGDHVHWPFVPCISLARFIKNLRDGPIILKLDAEGAEYELLEHLIATNVDKRLERVLVEWHPHPDLAPVRREVIEEYLACPLEEWRW